MQHTGCSVTERAPPTTEYAMTANCAPRHLAIDVLPVRHSMAILFDFEKESAAAKLVFARDGEHLTIRHIASRTCVLTFDGAPSQVIEFDDLLDALLFLNNVESELVRTGWTLTDFRSMTPEMLPALKQLPAERLM